MSFPRHGGNVRDKVEVRTVIKRRSHHPHAHMIVPGGGLSARNIHWPQSAGKMPARSPRLSRQAIGDGDQATIKT
jgi:hypothetical protein